jgi:hypothetical protein
MPDTRRDTSDHEQVTKKMKLQPKPTPTAKSHPERDLFSTSVAISKGLPFSRPLTRAERLALAVTASRPSHHLTIHSRQLGRDEMANAWRCFVKRIDRAREGRRLVYLATLAKSQTHDGYHVHALLWEFLYARIAHKHCRELGLGKPHLSRVPSWREDSLTALRMTSYVLGQHEAIFGTTHHQRHAARSPNARRLLSPLPSTLAKKAPALLSALESGKDKSVSDLELANALPKFIRRSKPRGRTR